MYNLLISLGFAFATFVAFYQTKVLVAPWASLVGVIFASVAYFLLARRSLKSFERLVGEAQKDLGSARQGNALNKARVEAGIAKIKEGFKIGRWQYLINPQVHAQLGMLYFALEREDEARPHLTKSLANVGMARAMLAVLHYREKKYDAMAKTFEEAVRGDKKNILVWSSYAWCLDKVGQRDKGIEVLNRALKQNPADETLKANHQALQNKERMRMKGYGQEWWSLRLEPVPMDFIPAGMRPPQSGFRKGYRQAPKQRSR